MLIEIKTATNTYPVVTGRGLLTNLPQHLPTNIEGKKIAIITDDNVSPLYLEGVLQNFNPRQVFPYILRHGERSKKMSIAEKICKFLAEKNFSRKDMIFALGGGVVGDLAGFVASIYMRGIDYIQLPTTILAGIDSSVGGKTAVNLPYGKNLIGRIYPPSAVIFDLDTIKTLPKKYFTDGLGEGLKYAVLVGEPLFSLMKKGLTEKNFEEFIERCVLYKKAVVESDENESGQRKMLNLGHTLGHALERASNLRISHGVCVSVGLRLISRACYKNGLLPAKDYVEISALLDSYAVPDPPRVTPELLEMVKLDKKTESDVVHLVTVHGIGDCRITPVSLQKMEEFFN